MDVDSIDPGNNEGGRRGVPLPVIGVLLLLVIAGGVAALTGVGRATRSDGSSVGGTANGDSGDSDAPPVDNQSLALSDADAKYLQDAEHLGGFVLGDLSLPDIGAAIGGRDKEGLASYLASGFSGQLFSPEAGQAGVAGCVRGV